ncbi:2-oxo-tetronate isomerase [Roseospira visakhapatnamensis]|uniref:Hydroxypyruvate isomerase n=1 Tax=Roseospira visakhapatnamensis TaxID=390880 RepID=A0A7W6RBL9_9PROT|nr:2-oxo-tetronate isomerase [Roseospira visakhapatnamensis]MBB4265462.1 hydroxypyruvate isomerase [Roseospira visakhapatnamensis]
MPRLAANLSMMFTEVDFLDRFAAAAAAGFQGVEYLFPYAWAAGDIAERLRAHGLTQALFNMPPGDWEAGERGLACLPGREADFRAGVVEALSYAETLGCARIHAMAGIRPPEADPADLEAVYVRNLRFAAAEAAKAGRIVTIEPINPIDMPGYFLATQADARRFIGLADAPDDTLKVQFDLYHCQMSEGGVSRAMDRQWPFLGHVQIAAVPGRNEPDQGEMDVGWLLDRLDARGYEGWVGCEYRPRGATTDGLAWARRFGVVPQDGRT